MKLLILFLLLLLVSFLIISLGQKKHHNQHKRQYSKISKPKADISSNQMFSKASLPLPDLSQKCKMGKYLISPDLSPLNKHQEGYDNKIATIMMAVAFNVEISNCTNMGPLPKMSQFDVQLPLYGKSFLGIPRMFAYFLYSTIYNVGIFSFTGTFYMDEWAKDMEDKQVVPSDLQNYKSGILIHEGFYTIYQSMIPEIRGALKFLKPGAKLFITGHSLGGAMATVCAFDLASYNPAVYSFASPRVFNPAGADQYKKMLPNSYRVFNTEDLVTTVPLPVGTKSTSPVYEHVDDGYSFTNNLGEVWFNHTYAYLHYYGLADKNWMPPV